jgi:hypothetical protein
MFNMILSWNIRLGAKKRVGIDNFVSVQIVY